MATEYDKRIEEIGEDILKLVKPSQELAIFVEKLFMLLGEMNGTIEGKDFRIKKYKDALE